MTQLQRLACSAELEVWHVNLDEAGPSAILACLSSDELARARRFAFERDRHRFITGRTALRHVLSKTVAHSPQALHFSYGPLGKPFFSGSLAKTRFNLSHSGAEALIAISNAYEVGVDVEVSRDVPDAMALASSCFTASECDMLQNMPHASQSHAFLTCWTRKEACLKAIGAGFNIDPRTVEVGIHANRQRVQLTTAGDATQLQVHSFVHLNRMICSVANVAPPLSHVIDRAPTEQELA